MKSFLTEFLTMLTALTGVYAAALWDRASKVPVISAWERNGGVEPCDQLQAMTDWIVGMQEAGNKAAALNRRAARWTAISVLLAAIATVVGNIV